MTIIVLVFVLTFPEMSQKTKAFSSPPSSKSKGTRAPRNDETPEERINRLKVQRERQVENRASETPEECEERIMLDEIRHIIWQNVSYEERSDRLNRQ